jgi:integrase
LNKRTKVNVDHGIVALQLDSVKTEGSSKSMNLDPQLLSVLSTWRQVTEFRADDNWIFSSPYKLGRLPSSYTGYHRIIENAARAAGLGRLGTHSFRHYAESRIMPSCFCHSLNLRLLHVIDSA